MTNFYDVDEIDLLILDVAYEQALKEIESNLRLWRNMKTPQEILALSETDGIEDRAFYLGGCVALEALKSEVEAARNSLFLSV